MLFENFVSLVEGELKNDPSISSFTNIAFSSEKVKRGDLYFGDSKGISEALKNGAYAIVSDRFRVKDKEIAWIKVKDIYKAKLKLLRYFIVKNSLYTLYLDSVEAEIAKSIELDKNYYIDHDIEKAIKELSVKEDEKLVIFLNKEIFKKLDLLSFEVVIKHKIELIKSTIFLTTFLYKGQKYKDIKLPVIFKEELQRVLNLFDDLEIKYSVEKLNFIEHFKPLFLDSYFNLLGFGQSTKVLILESEKDLFFKEIEYLKRSAPWAKILLLIDEKIKLSKDFDLDIKYYKNYADIKELNIFCYNFVMMLDEDKGFEKYLQKKDINLKNTLF